ncbi:MAG: IclR family transcriptional regulator [Pseudomonadota bacterium]
MTETANTAERSGIQVIARAAAILRTLRDNPSGMSLGQIAERVALPRSTVQRIIGALVSERLVISGSKGGGVRLGPELGSLAEAARYSTVEQCRPVLADLTEETGETTDLSVLRGDSMIFLDQVPGLHRLRTVSFVGEVFPLTTTANGRACLAQLPENVAQQLVEREWDSSDREGSIVSMMARLKDIRTQGLAYDLEEHTSGISAIGFAFKDWAGDLHAISVPIPSSRFDTARLTVEAALQKAMRAIKDMMGAREMGEV